jgi:hypothetical protein
MIIVEFLKGQGLGNQLWNYASGRSIAENKNKKLFIKNYSNFIAKDFLKLNYYKKYVDVKYDIFCERLIYDNNIDYISSAFDERIDHLCSKKNYLLTGLFQSEKYFYSFSNKLNSWIIPKFKNKISLNDDICIINLRGGEYKRHKAFILPESYWLNAIKYIQSLKSINEFIVVTDDRKYAKALFPNFKIISGNVQLCYNYIHNCKNIIISNSTFSYFPIKTSNDKKLVIAPKNWARYNNSYNRWASPANFYKDWLYMDDDGVFNYDDLVDNVNETINYYKNNNIILVDRSQLSKKTFLSFVPKNIKKIVKKLLSYLFPKNIG